MEIIISTAKPYRFNTFSTKTLTVSSISKYYLPLSTKTFFQKRNVRMDIIVGKWFNPLVKVDRELEERRDDEEERNDRTGRSVILVALLYLLDHKISAIESSETSFSQDRDNSSQHLNISYISWDYKGRNQVKKSKGFLENSILSFIYILKVSQSINTYQSVLTTYCEDSLDERYYEASSDNSGINLIRNEADVEHECSLQ